MNARNPFSSISNFSFLRNAQHLSGQGRLTRTNSSHKKYFDYQGSYLRDSYLRDWEIRKNQQQITSKVMGIEALRYMPQPQQQQEHKYLNSKVEYYNLQNYQRPKDNQAQQPLKRSKSNHICLQKSSTLKQSNINQNTASQKALKCSTKDMFGSDYFNDYNGALQSQQDKSSEDKQSRKSNFQKKQTPNISRFKLMKESKQLSQLKQEQEYSRAKTNSIKKQKPPQNFFFKSRGKMFYLYHQQTQS